MYIFDLYIIIVPVNIPFALFNLCLATLPIQIFPSYYFPILILNVISLHFNIFVLLIFLKWFERLTKISRSFISITIICSCAKQTKQNTFKQLSSIQRLFINLTPNPLRTIYNTFPSLYFITFVHLIYEIQYLCTVTHAEN